MQSRICYNGRVRSDPQGFTLVELSVVLVIIGLITAGITGGQKLVEQAKLRNVIVDLNGYKTAYNTYRLKYASIPGDHKNATDYWPGQTANGNGDGIIFDHDGEGMGQDEDMKAMQHLVLAGFVAKQSYFASYWPQVVGNNVPSGPFGGQGYRFQSVPWRIALPWGAYAAYGKRTGNGMVAGVTVTDVWGAFLTSSQAQSVDAKMDDGLPASGDVHSLPHYGITSDCNLGSAGTWTDPGQNTYNVGNTAIACNIYSWLN